MTRHLDYETLAYNHNRIRDPIEGLAIYENRRQKHCDHGAVLSKKQHIKFAVLDERAEEVVYQSPWILERETARVQKHRHHTIGYRSGLIHGRGQEDDQ